MHLGRTGTLATQSRKRPGFPFGSVAPYGLDESGRPTFRISTMAMHTQNLAGDPRASLLVAQPGWTEDPLAGARVTLLGPVERVPAGEVEPVRANYLARHESARSWVGFDDFAFYRMEVRELYFVAGFGAMGWVEADAYRTAAPDPLADSAQAILEHMNADHATTMNLYATALLDAPAADWACIGIDPEGLDMRAGDGRRLRLNFPQRIVTPDALRRILIEFADHARGGKQ